MERLEEPDSEAGLLAHLADRGLLEAFPRLHGPLREAPDILIGASQKQNPISRSDDDGPAGGRRLRGASFAGWTAADPSSIRGPELGGFPKIVPQRRLEPPIVQDRRGMIRRKDGEVPEREGLPPRLFQLDSFPQKPLQGGRSERHHDLWADRRDLGHQIRTARFDLVGPGSPVRGRPALHDIRDEHGAARKPRRRERLVEDLPRRPDER